LDAQFNLEHRLAYRFSVLSTQNVRCLGGVYTKKFGISTAGWRIMSIIGRYEPIFPGVAAQRCTMSADKLTRVVDRLVRLGYVVRNTDEADRRRVILCLTPRGRSVYNEVEALHQRMDAQWRQVLSQEENAILDGIMRKLEERALDLFSRPPELEAVAPARAVRRGAAAKRAPLGGKRALA